MKSVFKKLIMAVTVIMLITAVLALTSCMEGIVIPGVTDTPGENQGGNGNNGGGEDDPFDDGKGDVNTVSFRYNNETVYSVELKKGEGLDAAAVKSALSELGYDFNDYCTKSDYSEQFNFKSEITGDMKVFCRTVYTATYWYGTDKVLIQKIDSRSKYFSEEQVSEARALTNNGVAFTGLYNTNEVDADIQGTETEEQKAQYFDFTKEVTESVNIYCKIFYVVTYRFEGQNLFRQRVDSFYGFSEKQIARKTDYLHNGYDFSGFYTDEALTEPVDFETPPTENFTVYCERDLGKAGKNVTWSVDGTTLIFEGEGPMYKYEQYDTDVPWRQYYMQITDVVIEEGITSVANCAFYGFRYLTDVTLPDSIVHIGDRAFYQSAIVNINFPDAVRSIGDHAFHGCEGLVHLNFNAGLEVIEPGAFYECTSLMTVVLTDTIMKFGTSSFQDCENISSAFYIGTEEQYNQIDIQLNNFWINELAHTYFISDEAPEEPGPYWYYDENGDIKQWYYTIWYLSNDGIKVPFFVDYVDASTGLITEQHVKTKDEIVYEGYKFYRWKEVTSKTVYELIPGNTITEDIKLIGDRGNLCGDNLQWSVRNNILTIQKIDSSLSDGDMWDFAQVKAAPWYSRAGSITRVDIKSGVTHIGSFAFSDIANKNSAYSNFTYIVIPKSVTDIHTSAFSGCTDLLYIYFEGTREDIYGESKTITGLDSLVGIGRAVVYANATGLDYATLGSGAFWTMITGSDGLDKRVAWVYDETEGTILVGGGDDTHIMVNYTSVEATPWYSYRDNIKSVTVNSNITTIGHHSFENMTAVEDILVTRRITKTSGSAFVGTKYYTDMYEKEGVVYLYTGTEGGNGDVIIYAHLLKVDPSRAGELFVMKERTLSIAENAFEGCSGIKSLLITKDLMPKAVYSTALSGLVGVENIYYEGLKETWHTTENTQTGEGELLSGATVYFYSATDISGSEDNLWYWNEDYTAPKVW
ncbi:MAG: leucine-rich repeat protein [Clostridia bacterium]|nr:leucine-rich repeat protein [Clostridia bacterium]